MKRWAVIIAGGITLAMWYPGISAAIAGGLVIGWLGIEQPHQAEDFITTIKQKFNLS